MKLSDFRARLGIKKRLPFDISVTAKFSRPDWRAKSVLKTVRLKSLFLTLTKEF